MLTAFSDPPKSEAPAMLLRSEPTDIARLILMVAALRWSCGPRNQPVLQNALPNYGLYWVDVNMEVFDILIYVSVLKQERETVCCRIQSASHGWGRRMPVFSRREMRPACTQHRSKCYDASSTSKARRPNTEWGGSSPHNRLPQQRCPVQSTSACQSPSSCGAHVTTGPSAGRNLGPGDPALLEIPNRQSACIT
jgi:hypothetical protein